jgi:hypothetical protein
LALRHPIRSIRFAHAMSSRFAHAMSSRFAHPMSSRFAHPMSEPLRAGLATRVGADESKQQVRPPRPSPFHGALGD